LGTPIDNYCLKIMCMTYLPLRTKFHLLAHRSPQNGPTAGGQRLIPDLCHHVTLLRLQRQIQPQSGNFDDVRSGKKLDKVI